MFTETVEIARTQYQKGFQNIESMVDRVIQNYHHQCVVDILFSSIRLKMFAFLS